MNRLLRAESKLTDRYQTTIPEPIREVLHLGKRDKITYTLEKNGTVLLSRTVEEDPVLDRFLFFLANDIGNNPQQVRAIDATLLKRAQSLVSHVKIDLDAPLSDEDE